MRQRGIKERYGILQVFVILGMTVLSVACGGGNDGGPSVVTPPPCSDADGDGHANCTADCDPLGRPCDCNDANRSLTTDCGAGPCADNDGDGYVVAVGNCTVPSGLQTGDCNDTDRLVHPGAAESYTSRDTCLDQKDNDCDGIRDGADPGCSREEGLTNIQLPPLYPSLVRGDREFDGHGPSVVMTARLENAGTRIRAIVTMRAEETVPNQTLAVGSMTYYLPWTAQSGERIDRIITDTESSCTATDFNHEWNYCDFGPSELVRRFAWIGDTSGDDICTGSSSCTQVIPYLNTVRFVVRVGN